MSTSIYTAYHKPSHVIANEAVKPILVGAAQSNVDWSGLRDDSGENISTKNSNFCELTALFWAWKNDKGSDFIGLQHYRRFLDLRHEDSERKVGAHGTRLSGFTYDFSEKIGIDAKSVGDVTSKYDAVLPEPFDVTDYGFESVRDHYRGSDHHILEDLELVRTVILERCPDFSSEFDAILNGTKFYQTNTFILRRNIFEKYASWLFDILFALENRLNIVGRTFQESRVFGYLSERLFNVFWAKYCKEFPETTALEVPLCFVEDTAALAAVPTQVECPDTRINVQIALATDTNFVPYCHALIASILQYRNQDVGLNIIILEGGLSPLDLKLFKNYERANPNLSISFLTMKHAFSDLYLRPPFTKETFYRLSLANLLPNHKRIIYLDVDTVVCADVAELWEFDLQDAPVAATRDYINLAFQNLGTHTDVETGRLPAKQYATQVLGLAGVENKYFQAGVLVLNLDVFRKEKLSEKLIDDLIQNKYWFLDQDVLNKHLCRRARELPQKWNVVYLGADLLKGLNQDQRDILSQAYLDPSLAHYAGIAKPWENNLHPLSVLFWQAARATPFYEMLSAKRLQGRSDQKFPHPGSQNTDLLQLERSKGRGFLYNLGRKIYGKLPKFVLRFLSRGLVYKIARRL